MNNIWVLAQTESNQGSSQIASEPMSGQTQQMTTADGSNSSPPPQDQAQAKPSNTSMMPLLLLGVMFVLMYLTMFRGPKKKQQEHKQMLQALKKNDRVRTIGGIYGTVMEVKGDEVVLKIDEATNTKIRVSNSAISLNMSKESQ